MTLYPVVLLFLRIRAALATFIYSFVIMQVFGASTVRQCVSYGSAGRGVLLFVYF